MTLHCQIQSRKSARPCSVCPFATRRNMSPLEATFLCSSECKPLMRFRRPRGGGRCILQPHFFRAGIQPSTTHPPPSQGHEQRSSSPGPYFCTFRPGRFDAHSPLCLCQVSFSFFPRWVRSFRGPLGNFAAPNWLIPLFHNQNVQPLPSRLGMGMTPCCSFCCCSHGCGML